MKNKKITGSKPRHERNPNEKDIELLEKFLEHYGTIKGLSKGSKEKYCHAVKQFSSWLKEENTDIQNMKEEHALKIINKLQNSKWSEASREDNWERFTRVVKWINKQTTLSPEVTELLFGEEKYRYKIDHNKVTKKGILTPTEILKLLSYEYNLRYKAFYSVLYESGTRSGEIFSLRKCDVKEQANGTLYLDLQRSKTVKRKIPLVKLSVRYLRQWLKEHSGSEDAPLWLNTRNKPLDPFAANKHLKCLLEGVGISTKKVSLHSFRHSRATELAQKGLSEFEMCKFFGWRIGSNMPATYIREQHLDVESRLLQAEGLAEQVKPASVGKSCLQCENVNSDDSEYCELCSMPLDHERLKDLKTEVNASHLQDLLKSTLREAKAEMIEEIKQEIVR